MLEVIIITYNRSNYLEITLNYLLYSVISKYKITVLNNASTDNTLLVCESFKHSLPNFHVVSHRNNIGLGGNIIRALEMSESSYTWILCDDDFIDLSSFEDVEEVISKGEVDLIHVGGHPQKEWLFGGKLFSAGDLYKKGYTYFKFSSFLPANIFKTDLFQKNFLVAGYNNVVNAYPHMPYLFSVYQLNSLMYISKKQIVTAKVSGQSYTMSTWFYWWMKTCELLSDKLSVRNAYLDQWKSNDYFSDKAGLQSLAIIKQLSSSDNNELAYINSFVEKYFSTGDRLRITYYGFNLWLSKYKMFNKIHSIFFNK